MITSVHIKNFKSVVDLSLDLGTFNVLIGENGCGKSNILEAMAFGAAASADKLDQEFFWSRGLRVPNPEFMFSAFSNVVNNSEKKIQLNYYNNDRLIDNYQFIVLNDQENPKKWINELGTIAPTLNERFRSAMFEHNVEERKKKLRELTKNDKDVEMLEFLSSSYFKNNDEENGKKMLDAIFDRIITEMHSNNTISNFIIYSLEQSILRKFEDSNQIYPLGIRGEGLFQYLKDLAANEKNKEILTDIKNNLILLDWYETFELPDNSMSNDFSLKIKDKYLDPNLQYFDQRSTNEGFLYLLFYSALFISKDTPAFFSIDNIDASLNPKLCVKLIRNIAELAKKNNKQVIVTTQNPAVLDGLNLKDDSQRLFVVRRNDEGHTKAKRIEYKAERQMKLSEVWLNGFIGGLPENF